MAEANHSSKVAQSFTTCQVPLSQLLLPTTDSMIHHKEPRVPERLIVSYHSICTGKPYGVSQSQRVLSPGLLLKRFDRVRDCLKNEVGLTVCQREVTLKLLRLFAYYGQVYPKASHFGQEPGSSVATFWRTIKVLREHNLVSVVNRFVLRPHAQISNLYRLDRLVLLLARYLAEHGHAFYEKWLEPYLSMPGRLFYPMLWQSSVREGVTS